MVWFSGLKRRFRSENQTVICILGRRLEFFTASCPRSPPPRRVFREEAARRFLSTVYATFDQLAPKAPFTGLPRLQSGLGRFRPAVYGRYTVFPLLGPSPPERAFLLRCLPCCAPQERPLKAPDKSGTPRFRILKPSVKTTKSPSRKRGVPGTQGNISRAVAVFLLSGLTAPPTQRYRCLSAPRL